MPLTLGQILDSVANGCSLPSLSLKDQGLRLSALNSLGHFPSKIRFSVNLESKLPNQLQGVGKSVENEKEKERERRTREKEEGEGEDGEEEEEKTWQEELFFL